MKKKTKVLLTAGELKRLLEDVYEGFVVHVSGCGAVQEVEIKNGKLYIRGYENKRSNIRRHDRDKGL